MEVIVSINPDECLKAIKSNLPDYYEISESFMPPKYSYKATNGGALIIGRGFGYPEISLKVVFDTYGVNKTKIDAKFSKNIVLRAFIWILSMVLFFFSLLYILGIILGDIPLDQSPILTWILPTLVLLVSISYISYTEIIRRQEIKKIKDLFLNIFLKWTESEVDSTAKTGCLTPMGVFNSKNCLEQIAQKVLFQLKIANLDLHYYGFVFVNLNLGIISLLLAFSASLACPEPSGKTA